jgi:cysteine desulfurase/selenocysteine lyase
MSNKIFQTIQAIRNDFPILKTTIKKQPLIYFDNGATTQKPNIVINEIVEYYTRYNANIHRGKYALSQKASSEYDLAKDTVAKYINCDFEEVIFTKGTTESLNFVACAYGKQFFEKGDVVLVSEMEHHSNMIPFQVICKMKGAKLIPITIDDKGDIDLAKYEELIKKYGKKIKLISVCHVSNALGTINPIKKLIETAHASNIPVCIDAAQSIAHCKIDVKYLDCDFLAFSGHKMYAPTGIGCLYAKKKILEAMQPYQFGGGMIKQVSFEATTWADLPEKFEAGTPNIEGAIGMMSAINYIKSIGIVNIYNYEKYLTDYCFNAMSKMAHVKVVGNPLQRASLISFNVDGYTADEICEIMNSYAISVRSGYLCTIPLMQKLQLKDGVARVSFGVYNTIEEVEFFLHIINSLKKLQNVIK